ncbi:MAG: prepilin-type N-terminal cleavage/methylation domain-containing protein [Planctomycetota bacterium]|jgi:type II secretory pathway pseudopilin PulG
MARRSGGFTLVELVVALGVVLLLAGLTLTVGVKVIEASESRQTHQTLTLLEHSILEWELTSQRKLSWFDYTDMYDYPQFQDSADVHWDTPEVLIITEILAEVDRTEGVRKILAQIDPKLVYRYQAGEYPAWIDTDPERQEIDGRFDGAITVLDAWGTPIYATHPGRAARAGDPRVDPDGTMRTYNEVGYGVAPNRQVVFVSAGPDRRFGLDNEYPHLQGSDRNAALEAARSDNLYSTVVTFPEKD